MKNNLLGKIAMSIKNIGKARLDFTHDVSTTASFGDLQPSTCKLILPKSNGVVESKTLVRFGTMVAPTFGRIKTKEYHHLVPLSDLFENFAFMLAQGKRSNGDNILSPDYVPHMTLGLLSRLCLIGAEVEIYPQVTEDSMDSILTQANSVDLARTYKGAFPDLDNYINENRVGQGVFTGYKGTMFNLGKLTKPWAVDKGLWSDSAAHDWWIPVRNRDKDSFFGIKKVNTWNEQGQPTTTESIKHMNLDSSSLNLTVKIDDSHSYVFAFRLSSFGKRLRKQIIGAGKQVSLCSTGKIELVSLAAIAKTWFDLFGLTLWENYEISPLGRFCRWCDYHNYTNLDSLWGHDRIMDFIMMLGSLWYTDAQDVVSAHVTSTAISPSLGLGSQFVDVDGTANISETNNAQGQNINGHAFISAIEHGQLDAEYLQRLYVWCNKNTIAGKAIEKVLRAQGLGDFVDSCKSNFIGYHEETMTIFDVVSTSDTFKDGEGSMLGEYGGRGIKVYESGSKKFSTNEFAYQVSLFTIVPEAGYLQPIDPSSYCIKKTDFLLGEFDALGMEATRKTIVCGAENWSSQVPNNDGTFGTMDETFGLIPRGTRLKIAQNISNGDITLRDTRAAYLPYTVDKFVDVGERACTVKVDHANYTRMQYTRELIPDNVPVASLHYRFPCRYPWMGNFERIFAYQGEPLDSEFYYNMIQDEDSAAMRWELLENSYDNFIVHMIVTESVWSPCKPIEESFETYADGEKPNAKMDKA